MSWGRRRREPKAPRESKVYQLPDPGLRAYDRGSGILSVDDEVMGHLACDVRVMTFPQRAPWPWFVVVWPGGSKEPAFEDYRPSWWTVRQLDAGYLEHHGPSKSRTSRFGFEVSVTGPPCRYDFRWLPSEEAAEKWSELGLVDSDF